MKDMGQQIRQLTDKNNRLEDRIKQLQGHIALQRAEIIMLQNRSEKSEQLQRVFTPPRKGIVKTFEIDNRSEQ